MNEPRRVRDMTDHELVELVRGLPERAVGVGLRDRLLSGAVPARPRRGLHPAFALAALFVLLIADAVTLRIQGRLSEAGAFGSFGPQARAMPREEAPELAPAGLSIRVAMRPVAASPAPYLAVCKDLLRDADGG